MIKNLAQLNQCHFCILSCRIDNLAPEALAEAVAAEVLYIDTILPLDILEKDIEPLNRIYLTFLTEEAGFFLASDFQRLITRLYMWSEIRIDVYNPAFCCFLLNDDDFIGVKDHRPGQPPEV